MLEMIVGDIAGSQSRQSTNARRKLRDLVLSKRQRRDVLEEGWKGGRRRKRQRGGGKAEGGSRRVEEGKGVGEGRGIGRRQRGRERQRVGGGLRKERG